MSELRKVTLPNGDFFYARIKPKQPKLTDYEVKDRAEMKLRRRSDYTQVKKALELLDQGTSVYKAAKLSGARMQVVRMFYRDRIFMKKYGVTRFVYQWRRKRGLPMPNMTRPSSSSPAPA